MRYKSKYNCKDHIPRKNKIHKAEDLNKNCNQIVSYSFHKTLLHFILVRHKFKVLNFLKFLKFFNFVIDFNILKFKLKIFKEVKKLWEC